MQADYKGLRVSVEAAHVPERALIDATARKMGIFFAFVPRRFLL